jgi:hypothetical protein
MQYLDIGSSLSAIVFDYNATQEFVSLVDELEHLRHVLKVRMKLQGFHAYAEGV